MAFNGQNPDRGNKILCPFHDEKTASFQVYENGFYCFGCGEHGDSVAFVAIFEGIRPIEAAKLIAEKFGLAVDQLPTNQKRQIVHKLKRDRNLVHFYKMLEEKAFLNMANFRTQALRLIELVKLDGLDDETIKAYHMLPIVEDQMMTLITGSPEERLRLFREGVLTKWAALIK